MNSNTEKYYAIAAQEVASNKFIPGIMAKAFSDANGDEKITIAIYLRLRVIQLEEQFEKEKAKQYQNIKSKKENELSQHTLMSSKGYRAGVYYSKHKIFVWSILMGFTLLFIWSLT